MIFHRTWLDAFNFEIAVSLMISWRRVDKNGFWDEMHCENNVKNFACQIPVGNKSRKDFSKYFNKSFNERIFSIYFQFVTMDGHGQKVCASGDAYITASSRFNMSLILPKI